MSLQIPKDCILVYNFPYVFHANYFLWYFFEFSIDFKRNYFRVKLSRVGFVFKQSCFGSSGINCLYHNKLFHHKSKEKNNNFCMFIYIKYLLLFISCYKTIARVCKKQILHTQYNTTCINSHNRAVNNIRMDDVVLICG